jgi:hypothetical protein
LQSKLPRCLLYQLFWLSDYLDSLHLKDTAIHFYHILIDIVPFIDMYSILCYHLEVNSITVVESEEHTVCVVKWQLQNDKIT